MLVKVNKCWSKRAQEQSTNSKGKYQTSFCPLPSLMVPPNPFRWNATQRNVHCQIWSFITLKPAIRLTLISFSNLTLAQTGHMLKTVTTTERNNHLSLAITQNKESFKGAHWVVSSNQPNFPEPVKLPSDLKDKLVKLSEYQCVTQKDLAH